MEEDKDKERILNRLVDCEKLLSDLLERKEGDFICPLCNQKISYWPEGHIDTCVVPRTIRYMERYYGKRVR